MGRPLKMSKSDLNKLLKKDKSDWSKAYMIVKIKSLERQIDSNRNWVANLTIKLKKKGVI